MQRLSKPGVAESVDALKDRLTGEGEAAYRAALGQLQREDPQAFSGLDDFTGKAAPDAPLAALMGLVGPLFQSDEDAQQIRTFKV